MFSSKTTFDIYVTNYKRSVTSWKSFYVEYTRNEY